MEESSCIFWNKAINGSGYGVTWYKNKIEYAHRRSYLENKGDIPEGMFVCHSCDNRMCINPDHLFLGYPKDNSKDMVKKERQAKGTKTNHTKLTEKDVNLIRQIGNSLSRSCVAKLFGISRTNVTDIIHRKIWKHV